MLQFCLDCRRAGSTGSWIIGTGVGMVLLVVVAIYFGTSATDQRVAESTDPQANHFEKLEAVQQKLQAAIANHRDVAWLIPEARSLVREQPDGTDARLCLAQIFMLSNRHFEAYEQLSETLELKPGQAEVQDLAGTVAMELDQLVLAEKHYALAVAAAPVEARFRVHLAQAQMMQEKSADARQTLRECLNVDSSLHVTRAMLSELDAHQGNLEAAIEQIRRALELTPSKKRRTRLTYTLRHAQLLLQVDQPAQGLVVLQALPLEERFDDQVMRQMAACWQELGQPDRAARQYESSLILRPTDDSAAAHSARWYLEADDLAAAQRMVDLLHQINPRSVELPKLLERLRAREK